MKSFNIADEPALKELSEIFHLDVDELRHGWGSLPFELSSDQVRMDIVRSMSERARRKFLSKYQHTFKRYNCPVCGEVITKQIKFMHNRSQYHLAHSHAQILCNVNEI